MFVRFQYEENKWIAGPDCASKSVVNVTDVTDKIVLNAVI